MEATSHALFLSLSLSLCSIFRQVSQKDLKNYKKNFTMFIKTKGFFYAWLKKSV